jgi:hypothetical protein
MFPVSAEFLQKMEALDRHIFAKIQIDYTYATMDTSVEASASEQATLEPFLLQVADEVTGPSAKYIALDGSWIVGEDWGIAPGEEEVESTQIGWWGEQLADTEGYFTAPYPSISVSFWPRPIHALQVVGDSIRGEYPKDFTITVYDEDGVTMHVETVVDNTQIYWMQPVDSLGKVSQIMLSITKWSHPGRQAKVVEFFTSVQESYFDDDIITIDLLEEREVSGGSLPVGNISANELNIRLVNKERRFDAGNTNSPLYGLLRPNRRVQAWLGVERGDPQVIEYIPLGIFFSGEWDAPEDRQYVSTTCRDRLEQLRRNPYSTNVVLVDISLYDLVIAVLGDAGVLPRDYWVDSELKEFIIPYVYFDPMSHRDALRIIAEACLGQVYCDRLGMIRIEGPSFLASNQIPSLTISEFFRKKNPPRWSEVSNHIEVEAQPLRPGVTDEVFRSEELETIAAGQVVEITAHYNHTPCVEALARLETASPGCVIEQVDYFGWGVTVKVVSPIEGEFSLVIDARPLKVVNKTRVVARDEESIGDNSVLKFTFPENPLVQSVPMARNIADSLLASFKDPQRDVQMDWLGNLALLLADRITVQDGNEQNDYYITSQELQYSGALRCRLSGRKVTSGGGDNV